MTSIKGSPQDFNCPVAGSVAFSQVHVGFPIKNYGSLGLFKVNDIVSFDHQNETQNREMCRERIGREGWNAVA